MKIIAQNKKASHNFHIEDKLEAGIVLKGTEIKSVRLGKVNIDEAYVYFKNGEAFVENMHISKYDHGNIFNHEERRTRKLLLNKKEINKMLGKQKLLGYTFICTKIYIKDGFAKIEIAYAKGKKDHDRRQDIKEKDDKRRIEKTLNARY